MKPVVVIPDEDEPEQQDDDDDEPEPLIEVSDVSTPSLQAQPQVRHISHRCMHVHCIDPLTQVRCVSFFFSSIILPFPQQLDIFDQAFGPPNGGFDDR